MIVEVKVGERIYVLRATEKQLEYSYAIPLYMYKVNPITGDLEIPRSAIALYPFPLRWWQVYEEREVTGEKAEEYGKKIDDAEAEIATYPPEKNLLTPYKGLTPKVIRKNAKRMLSAQLDRLSANNVGAE